MSQPPPRIVMLSGEQCLTKDPGAKCQIVGGLAFHNRREYIAHHHGRYILRDNFTRYFEEVVAEGYSPAWAKIKILNDELQRGGSDWIFWIDTDAFITNMDIQLERFIDTRYSLIIARDDNFLNAGVFFLRVNSWSRNYVRELLSRMEKDSNEQDWMIKLLEDPSYESERHVKYIPQCSLNSYWHTKTLHGMYLPGDFVIHWAGHNFDAKSFEDWRQGHRLKLPF
ncbi:hypothetical protein DFQ27_004966 [Actinomortierella ambigua]|uniref:Uncharacterized protein n=1 Tax=Actinomortierella ambigua TaxID=1343610 RepID=A0A9P6QJV9_9FUNG|nr:hypothetical protein DFQ27_004966 [Actinomortierella ambigua]